jgi:hypothetical protein
MKLESKLQLNKCTLDAIDRRKTVLLDTSVWICLSDCKTKDATEVRRRLERLVDSGMIFCPLTPTNILELRKQSNPSLRTTAQLMEQLSLNVTFRGLNQLFEAEIANFLSYLQTDVFHPLSNSEKYGPIFSYLSKGFSVVGEPPNGRCSEYEIMCRHAISVVQNMSLTQLIQMLGEKSFPAYDEQLGRYQSTAIERRLAAGGCVAKTRKIEFEFIAEKIIIPKLARLQDQMSISDRIRIIQKIKLSLKVKNTTAR